jgi:uncharacterized LabA/DUF88 family protein
MDGLFINLNSMKKRVVILIDGQNLFYSLKDIGALEREIKWDLFFQSLLSAEDELSRTYWFRPQKILDNHHSHNDIRNQIFYKKFRTYLYDFKNDPSKVPVNVMAQVEAEAVKAEEWLKKKKTTFSQIEYNYDQLCLEFGDIEFVKTGVVKVNPFTQEYVGEKGVDISLAVKMIALSVENNCDKIILISGDYDYAEAIKFVKNRMTKIHIVKLHKGVPPKNRSVSRDLAILADRVIDVYETDLKTTFKK